MKTNRRGCGLKMGAALAVLALAGAAQAQSPAYLTRHWSTEAGDVPVSMGGATFVNHGLVAVGRLAASTRDFDNETLGSFSGMALVPSSWRRAADGSYSGDLVTLPDRGPNNVGPIGDTTDYANRIHKHHIVLRPYTGKTPAPASATPLSITPTGGLLLTDAAGAHFTGKDPGHNLLRRDGANYPSPAAGEGAGPVSLDPEAIAYLPDGGFYISDEYAAGIYLFDAKGHQTGFIPPVPALAPMTGGKLDDNTEKAPDTGRRNNQGLEAVSVTPDGKRLIAILQSATVQDTDGKNAATRNNTRVLVYDITASRTPAAPVGHYVLQLPVVRENGDGGPADVTAAQSEMLALNDHQFLVLSRDGSGRGKGSPNAPVFKSILLADLAGATNLAGTPYEQATTPVAHGGRLESGITPVREAELINLLNPVQLGRFGMNLDTAPSNAFSLPEKIEAMTLAPALDPKAPNDFFLFVGNDNDFETSTGRINGLEFDAGLKNVKGSGEGDNANIILVYRLTLPGR